MTHEVVWIDHREARILQISETVATTEHTVRMPHHVHRRHPGGGADGKEHPDDVARFFSDVGKSLAGATHVLLVGPANARLEFASYLHTHDRALEARIAGSETADHPTDGQLAAYGKKYFKFA